MQTTDKILSILNSMTVGTDPSLKTVLYESSFGANIRLDRNPDPAAILYLMKGFEIDYSTGLKYDKVDVEIFFGKRCDFAAKGEVIQSVLDSVELIISEFISLVFAEKSWKIEGKIVAQTAIAKFDCNMAGYSLQLTLVDRQGECI